MKEAYDYDDFIKFKKFLRKTKDSETKTNFCLQFSPSATLFETFPGENVNQFEKILASSEAKSAKYISLIWEEYEFWNNENILTCAGKTSQMLPIEFVIQSDKVQNFFSFLVFDWHNPDEHVDNDNKQYFLELKNKQLIEKSQKSLFHKLYEIIDNDETYHDVCLRIIYECLAEMERRHELEKEQLDCFKNSKNYSDDLKKLVSIETLLNMKNKEYQTKVLEILVTNWNILWTDNEFEKQKESILSTNKTDKTDNIDGKFFQLAFCLIEKNHIQFESDFEKFVKEAKRKYGHYHETIIKPVARLFLKIANTQKLSQARSFIFQKCDYLEINSTPLTNFEDFYKFNNKNIFPPNRQELIILVS